MHHARNPHHPLILALDHKVRDLRRLVLLKVLLEDLYDYDVRLVPIDLRLLKRYIAATGAQMVFWHHMRNYNAYRFVDLFRACGVRSGMIHTESVYGKTPERYCKYYALADDWSRLDLAFTGHPDVTEAAHIRAIACEN